MNQMLEAIAEALYVGLFVGMMAVLNQHINISQTQAKRRAERKRELARHELDKQCDMVYRLYQSEKQRVNRQTITVKGAFAEQLAEILAE